MHGIRDQIKEMEKKDEVRDGMLIRLHAENKEKDLQIRSLQSRQNEMRIQLDSTSITTANLVKTTANLVKSKTIKKQVTRELVRFEGSGRTLRLKNITKEGQCYYLKGHGTMYHRT